MTTRSTRNDLRMALRACRIGLIGTLAFSFFVNLLLFVAPLYMLQVYDRVLGSRSETTLLMLSIMAIGLLLTMGLLDGLRARLLTRTGARIDSRLNARVFQALLDRTLASNVESQTQPLRDLDTLRDFFSGQGFLAFCDAPWAPVFIFVGFLFHPWIGIAFVVGALVLFTLALLNELTTRRLYKEAAQHAMAANHLADANLRNAEVIAAMSMQPGLLQRWSQRHDEALALQVAAGDRTGAVMAASKTARTLVQVAVLTVGAYLVIHQQTTPGIMVAASIIMARALAPVEQAVGYWRVLIAAQSAYRRLAELLHSFPEALPKLSHPKPAGRLSAENIIVAPPGRRTPTLKGISFVLEPGEVLGVIGPSASGKSTLARTLVNVWKPSKGAVRLDKVELPHWNATELGRHIGYVPQDVELFEGTVIDNIARFGEVIDREIIAAAKKAGVHEMILMLPDGYETNIGAGGKAVSGGQRQRIALARALYGNPPVIVLDEPNSNLDVQGEQLLTQAIERMKRDGQTVVVVSHRNSLLACVDKLMLLVDGRIEVFGERKAVLQRLSHTAKERVAAQHRPEPASLHLANQA